MGWSTVCLFAGEGRGALAAYPSHDMNRTRDLLAQLQVRTATSKLSTLDVGLSPPSGWACVGAFPGATLLCGWDDLRGAVEGPPNPFVERCLSAFCDGSVLLLELSSATNYFAYALYDDGERRRAVAGDAERGVFLEDGLPQPEESGFYERSVQRDGRRVFHHDGVEYGYPAFGETLAFAMASRFTGVPLDRYRAEDLVVELVGTEWPVVRRIRHVFGALFGR